MSIHYCDNCGCRISEEEFEDNDGLCDDCDDNCGWYDDDQYEEENDY